MKTCLTTLSLFFVMFFTASCTTTKTAEQQQWESLRLACLNEAEVVNGKIYSYQAPSRGHSAPKIPDVVYKAKDLCHEMDDLHENGEENNQQRQISLAKECGAFLQQYAEQYPSDEEHVRKMGSICQKMTDRDASEISIGTKE